ncbi:MAG: CBS domain-containing protein [Actinobacteria bacterium]|nr:CBS domain-containing protein [Actinomycetota bacterium]
MATVREIMSTELVSVETTSTVAEAATVMGGRHVGSALVMEGGRLAGIFTERDILRALASDFDAAHHGVAQWMTSGPVSVSPDTPISEARDLMLAQGFRHLPVVEDGRVLGIVSLRDVTARD